MRALFAKQQSAARVSRIKAEKRQQREVSLGVRSPGASRSASIETSPTTKTSPGGGRSLSALEGKEARSMVVHGIARTLMSVAAVSRADLLRELYQRAAELSACELPVHDVAQLHRRYTETVDRQVQAGREVEHLRTQRAVDVTVHGQLETQMLALRTEALDALTTTNARERQLDDLAVKLGEARAVAQTEQARLLDELAELESQRAEEQSKAHVAGKEADAANSKIAAAQLAAREREANMFQTEMDSAEALHSMTTRLKTQREEMVVLSTEADRARNEAEVYSKSVAELNVEKATLLARVAEHEASLRLVVAQCHRASGAEQRRRLRVRSVAGRTAAAHAALQERLAALTKEVLRLRRVGIAREEEFLAAVAEANEETRRAERTAQRAQARSRFGGEGGGGQRSESESGEEDLSGDEEHAERVRQRTLDAKSEAAKTSRRVFVNESAKLVEHFGAAIQRAKSAKVEVALVSDMLKYNEQQPMPPPSKQLLGVVPSVLPPPAVLAVDDGGAAESGDGALDALESESARRAAHPPRMLPSRSGGGGSVFQIEGADSVSVLDDLRADLAALESELDRDVEEGGIDAIAAIGESVEVKGSLEELVIKLQTERAALLTQTCDQTEQLERLRAALRVLRERAANSQSAATAAETALDEAGQAGVSATYAWRSILEVLDVERSQHSDVVRTAQREADVALRKMRREKKRAAQQVAQFAESCRLLQNRLDDNELDLSKKTKEFLREKAQRMELETKLEGVEKKTARAIDALQKTVETARGTASETAGKLDASTRSLADVQQQLAVVQRGLSIKSVRLDALQRELDQMSESKVKADDEVHALKARVDELGVHANVADEARGAARSQLERQQGAMADRDERSRVKETELRDELQAVKDDFAKHSDAIAAAQRKGVEAEQRYSKLQATSAARIREISMEMRLAEESASIKLAAVEKSLVAVETKLEAECAAHATDNREAATRYAMSQSDVASERATVRELRRGLDEMRDKFEEQRRMCDLAEQAMAESQRKANNEASRSSDVTAQIAELKKKYVAQEWATVEARDELTAAEKRIEQEIAARESAAAAASQVLQSMEHQMMWTAKQQDDDIAAMQVELDKRRVEMRDRDSAIRLGATQLKECRAAMDKMQRAASSTIEGLQLQLKGVGSASTQEALHLMSELEMLQQQYAELSEEKATLEERLHALVATIEAAGGDAGAVRLAVEESARAIPAGQALKAGGDGVVDASSTAFDSRAQSPSASAAHGGGGMDGDSIAPVNLKAEEDDDDPFSEAAQQREADRHAGETISAVDSYLQKRQAKDAVKQAEKDRALEERLSRHGTPKSPAWAGGEVVVGREHARKGRR